MSALIDRGDKALADRSGLADDIANAAAMPSSVRKLWGEGSSSCSDFGGAAPTPLGFSLPMADQSRLYVLACGSPGAYNAASRLYLETAGAADVVPVPFVAADGPVAALDVWNVDWDGERLVSLFKGRGIGDCGSCAEYRLDPAGGLVLTEARDQPECNEQGDVDSWPQTWPFKGTKG